MLAPHFCNVDLDIESEHDLAGLEAELGRKVVALGRGPVRTGCFLLRLETAREYDNPDNTIMAFCLMLERLSAKGKRLWRSADKKEFDVGYEGDLSQHVSQFSLRSETLKRLSKLGASLEVTFYYHPKNKRNPSATRRKRK